MAKRGEHSLTEIKMLVLQAAETLISEEGISALTVRRIAMDIGYTVGSIYMVYANMADLQQHINARTEQQLREQLARADDVLTLATLYWQYVQDNRHRWQLLMTQPRQQQTITAQLSLQLAQLAPQRTASECERAAQSLWQSMSGICLLSLAESETGLENLTVLVTCFVRGWAIQHSSQTTK